MTVSPNEPAQEPIQRPEPLRETVYSRIVELIWSGRYEPGSALTEAALSQTLGVSRTPVREALLRLEAEGVLRSALARGFTVRVLERTEAAELYPILWTLEALAISTGEPPSADHLAELERLAGELAGEADPLRRWRLDTAWHESLVATCPNDSLRQLVTRLRTNLSRYEITYMRGAGSRSGSDHQHEQILTAVRHGERDRAAELVAEHWRASMHTILDWLDAPA